MTQNRVPLRWRIVIITISLLALGLIASGVAVMSVLRVTLINQLDDQLITAVKTTNLRDLLGTSGQHGPTSFAYQVQLDDAAIVEHVPSQFHDSPDFTTCLASEVGQPQTVSLHTDAGGWRCVHVTVQDQPGPGGIQIGSAVLALPLADVHRTLAGMAKWIAILALGLMIIGGSTAYWASRRALKPLRDIEHTAAKIAAGDLTERVAAGPVTTEVGSLGASLNTMLGQIEASFEARTRSEERMRQFVADASHELRTPLAAMRGYGELYRMGAITTPEATEDTMRRIEQSAARMGSLVEDLLNLARLDEARPLSLTEVDLLTLARDAATDAQAIDPGRSITVTGLSGGEPKPVLALADAARIRQVMLNLVSNVLSHTPSSAQLTIAVGTSDEVVRQSGSGESRSDGVAERSSGKASGSDEVPERSGGAVSRSDEALRHPGETDLILNGAVIEVRDTGPGISSEHQERVFERFYRVEKSRTRERGGAGLGMAIVDAIVAAHHGRVELESAPGTGTTVRVILPR